MRHTHATIAIISLVGIMTISFFLGLFHRGDSHKDLQNFLLGKFLVPESMAKGK